MKIRIFCGLLILALSLFLPVLSVKRGYNEAVSVMNETLVSAELAEIKDYKSGEYDSFKILDKSTGEIFTVSAKDYIIGVVSAEMPALYEKEALKAQAVAAFTYAVRKKLATKGEYDLTTDFNTDQCFTDTESLKKKWGDNFDEYYQKIESAVEETLGLAVIYKGEPALTVYHAISSGKTESCGDIWGDEVDYLVSVDSSFDKEASKYKTVSIFSADEIKEKISGLKNTDISPEKWFSDAKRTPVGSVKEITVCDKKFTGEQIVKALNLRSRNFTVEYGDNGFTFTVFGYGHGVGMSQNGANELAKNGSSYKEILAYYYKGTTVEKI